MNFLKQLQNAHIYYFTLTTLNNILEKAGYDLICGDEIINSIFKLSPGNNYNYKSDYATTISFLKKMEFYRLLPIKYNFKRLIMPILISILKCAGLYGFAREIYHKFKKYR